MKLLNYIAIGLFAAVPCFSQEKAIIDVVLPVGPDFDSVYSGLQRELGEDYTLKMVRMDEKSSATQLAASVIADKPKGIVALDNTALDVIKEIQKNAQMESVPVFTAAMLQVKQEIENKGIKNACGVQFEVPAFTQFSNLKQVSESKFLNVAVIFRKEFQSMIDISKEQLKKDNIELKPYCIDCDGKKLDEKSTVKALNSVWENIEEEKDLAIWVLADNGLLTSESMPKFWLSKVAKIKVPVVSPLEMFVTGQKPFGELALLALSPDFVELGAQLAGSIQGVLEDEEATADRGFEPLVSVKKYLNQKKAEKIKWNLIPDNLNSIDKLY